MPNADRPTPAQLEDKMFGLIYAVRDALMAQQNLGEVAATRIAVAIVDNLRRTHAGQVIQFPPLADAPAAR